jgi:predicted PurR-regulated permease PerM
MDTVAGREIRRLEQDYSPQELAEAFARQSEPSSVPWLRRLYQTVEPYIPPEEMRRLRESSMNFVGSIMSQVYEKTSALVTNMIQFAIGFAVMALALYYFFVDGPMLLRNMQALIPLENPDEEAVWEQFERVCRGVVLGTILAAFVQAVLLGAGLAVLGIERVWLLTGLTVLCALIPFVGAAGVYLPVSIYLAWRGDYGMAAGLTAYGALIVSTSDNLVRAYVIHGSSRLHPLAALVSVLGALSLVGLWGVFVGPIVAGIFYSMLTILQQKFRRLEEARQPAPEERNTIKSVHDVNQMMTPSSAPAK